MLFHKLHGLITHRAVVNNVFKSFFFYFLFYIQNKSLSYSLVSHSQYYKTISQQFGGYSPQRPLQELALFSNWHLCKHGWEFNFWTGENWEQDQ